jgi:hypothetical protein
MQYVTICIKGVTEDRAKEIAEQFMDWLNGSGEQAFWDYCGIRNEIGKNVKITYDYTTYEIRLTDME